MLRVTTTIPKSIGLITLALVHKIIVSVLSHIQVKEMKSPWSYSPPSIDLHGVSVKLSVACIELTPYYTSVYDGLLLRREGLLLLYTTPESNLTCASDKCKLVANLALSCPTI